jgi:hypothetical protein
MIWLSDLFIGVNMDTSLAHFAIDTRNLLRHWTGKIFSHGDEKDMKGALEGAHKKISLALSLEKDEKKLAMFRDANEKLGKALALFDEADKKIKDFETVKSIWDAYHEIDTDLIVNNPKKAAKQFDILINNCGKLLEKVGPPVSYYGSLLSSSGSFFSDMTEVMIGEKNSTVRLDRLSQEDARN